MTQEDPEAPAEIKPLTLATPSGRNGRSHTITATFRCQLSTVVIVSLSIALVATWVFGVRKFTQIDMQLEMLKENNDKLGYARNWNHQNKNSIVSKAHGSEELPSNTMNEPQLENKSPDSTGVTSIRKYVTQSENRGIHLTGDGSIKVQTTTKGEIRHWSQASTVARLRYEKPLFRFYNRNGTVQVTSKGFYLIYAQLVFLQNEPWGKYTYDVCVGGTVFMTCIASGIRDSCYVAGAKYMNAMERAYVTTTYPDTIIDMSKSYFGIVSI